MHTLTGTAVQRYDAAELLNVLAPSPALSSASLFPSVTRFDLYYAKQESN